MVRAFGSEGPNGWGLTPNLGPAILEKSPTWPCVSVGRNKRSRTGRPKNTADFCGLQSRMGFPGIEKWCRLQESNPRPSVYKTAALPAELNRRWPVPQGGTGEPLSGLLRSVKPNLADAAMPMSKKKAPTRNRAGAATWVGRRFGMSHDARRLNALERTKKVGAGPAPAPTAFSITSARLRLSRRRDRSCRSTSVRPASSYTDNRFRRAGSKPMQ